MYLTRYQCALRCPRVLCVPLRYRSIGSLGIAGTIDAAASAADATTAERNPAAARTLSEDIRTSARVAATIIHAVFTSPVSHAPARRVGRSRRKRNPMTLASKLRVVEWCQQGNTFVFIGRQLGGVYSETTLRNVAKRKDERSSRVAAGMSGDLT